MAERSADDIKRDIERSRAELASAVDQLVVRTSPKRVAENAKQTLRAKLNTPQGQAVVAAAGGLVLVLVVKRLRNADGQLERATARVAKKTAKKTNKAVKAVKPAKPRRRRRR